MRHLKKYLNKLNVLIMCMFIAGTSFAVWGSGKEVIKKTGTSFALLGMVASMKKKGKWETATQETKDFAEAYDEANAGLVELKTLEDMLKKFALATNERLTTNLTLVY